MYKSRSSVTRPSLFSNARPLSEEGLIIQSIKKQYRSTVYDQLTIDGVKPTEDTVESFLDDFIGRLKEDGTITRLLNKYLERKIKEEQSEFQASLS